MHDIARYNEDLVTRYIDTIRLREYKDSFPIVLLPNLLNTFKIAKILLILIFKIQYLHSAKSCCLRISPWIAVKPHFAHTTAVELRAIRGLTAGEPRLIRGRIEVGPKSNLGWSAVKPRSTEQGLAVPITREDPHEKTPCTRRPLEPALC
jgi:hypothetical protein